METGLRVSTERSVEWTTARPELRNSLRSSEFTVAGSAYHLEVQYADFFDGMKTKLFLQPKDKLADILHVTAILSTAKGLFFPCTTHIKFEGKNTVWKIDPLSAEISKVQPGFHEQTTLRFYVVFHLGPNDQSHSEDKSVQTPAFFDPHIYTQSLSEDLSKLLDGDSRADVELKCGDVTFKAHRSLLSVRSEVFRAMLDCDMAEKKTGQVQIVDAEADLFRHFLRYLYTGKLEVLTVDKAKRLYELGDKYRVEALKRECASFLAENLSPDIVCGILIMADRHTDGVLEEIVTAYIVDQKIPYQDDVWSDFCNSHPVLANRVLNRFFKLYVPCK